MSVEELCEYIEGEYGVKFDYPFSDDDARVFRHKGNRKWFGILMKVDSFKLKKEGNTTLDILNVKLDPLIREPMLRKKGVYVAYHMNKVHWISIVLNEICDDDLKFLIDQSFNLTKGKKH